MNGQNTKRPLQRRIIADVQSRRWAGPVTPSHPISVQAELKQVSRELTTFWQHLGRMIQTAGHSWGAGEHDVFLTPLYKLRKLTGRVTPRHMQRWQMAYFAMLVVALAAIPATMLVRSDLRGQRYQLSAATQKLVGEPIVTLDKQLSYDAKTAVYQYNPAAAHGVKPPSNGGDNGVSVGGSKYYGVNLEATAGKGQTFTDAQTKLSFTLVPQFDQLNGRHEDGHVVYPIDNGQLVYTLKSDGLKEDVVLSTPTDSLNLSYKLELPPDLHSKLLSDGGVGIYSAGATMVFMLPTPVIAESNQAKGTGKASFRLDGDILTVTASNLQNLSYPISIDPSVIVNNANSFTTGNNEDTSATISSGLVARQSITGGSVAVGLNSAQSATMTSGHGNMDSAVVYNGYAYVVGGLSTSTTNATNIDYAKLTSSGTVNGSGWQTTGANTLPEIKYLHGQVVAYNGYIYVMGGYQTSSGTFTNEVWYAQLSQTNGSVLDPLNGTAVGPANGTNNGWKATTSLTAANTYFSSVAYDGYIYMFGGCTALAGDQSGCNSPSNTVYSAAIRADGSLGSWTSSTAGWSARTLMGATVYNGYVYVGAGCSSFGGINGNKCLTGGANDVWFARLNGGTVGKWAQATSFTTGRAGAPLVAYGGYIYVLPGCDMTSQETCNGGSTTFVNDVSYAPIYANGSLGTWTSTNAMSIGSFGEGAFAYSGYLFVAGGCFRTGFNCSNSAFDSNYYSAAIASFNSATAPNGSPTSWGAGNTLIGTTGIYNAASVSYNGFIYTLGGCVSTTNCSSVNQSVQYMAVCSGANVTSGFTTNCLATNTPGTTTEWHATSSMSQARYDFGAFVYNGYVYAVGGCSTGTLTTCTSAQNTVERAAIQSDGSLGTWASAGTFAASGLWGIGVASYNGYAYITGGANTAGTVTGNVLYAPIGSIPALSTWSTAGTALSPGLFGTAAAAYGGYLYVAGGSTSVSSASGLTNTVQYTPLNSSTGAPGTWSTSSTYSATSLTRVAMQANDGVLYIIGGASSTPTYQNTVLSSPVQSSGALGSTWTSSTFTGTRQSASSAIAYGYLFVMGGYNASITNTTQIATLQTQDRAVQYSRIIDVTTANSSTVLPQVTRYLVTGTAGGSTLGCASYATTAGAAFGTVSCGYTTPYGIFGSLTKASTRYVFIYVTIDDSQQALFNDSNPSSISGLSVMFHSNPARRLRGGQTFTDNNKDTVNQLDTESP